MIEETRVYKTEELAELLGYKTRTLEDWRYHGVGPKFMRVTPTKGVRYLGRDVLAWLDSHMVAPTASR